MSRPAERAPSPLPHAAGERYRREALCIASARAGARKGRWEQDPDPGPGPRGGPRHNGTRIDADVLEPGAGKAPPLRVLMVTSEWPTPEHPEWAPFVVQQVEDLRALGVHLDVFAFRGRRSPWRYLQAWVRLRRRLLARSFDLVHAQYGQSALVAWPCPVPLVITFHGSDLQGIVGPGGRYTFQGRVLRALSRWAARRASAVIVVSERLARLLPKDLKVQVIPGGVDREAFRPMPSDEARRLLGLPSTRRLVLFPADPADPVKRFALARAAVERLQGTMDIELLSLGGVPHDRMPLYYNACDVVLVTSFHEGSPTVVKEALACNAPVVSLDVGDVAERVRGIEGCVVVRRGTPDELARGIAAAVAHGRLLDGREAVMPLDRRSVAERIVGVYRSLA